MLHIVRLLVWLLVPLLYCEASDYQDDDGQYYHQFDICENSIVQVTSIEVLCNSPQTYYYGNGVNRDSATCAYGDKATITVNFDVVEDLGDEAVTYIVLAAHTNGEVLYQSSSKSLCDNYVGDDCNNQGSYAFTKQVEFQYLGDDDGVSFVPVIEIAFSSDADGGSNLGGANIDDCYEESGEDGQYFDYFDSTEKEGKQGAGTFAQKWGIFLAIATAVVAFAFVMWKRNGGSLDVGRGTSADDDSSNSFELM